MSFTNPCFIRKNTPELRKKLEELGYEYGYEHLNNNFNEPLLACEDEYYWDASENAYLEEFTDCGTNEPMFLALAALRDDSDNGQWFVLDNYFGSVNYPDTFHPQGSMVFCTEENWKDMPIFGNIQAHKATPEEIVEHFEKL